VGVYLLGSTPELVGQAAQALRERHPALRIETGDGYFSADQAAARADAVRASGAALLLVGMGSPKQEAFIESQWERLGVAMAIGVGGSFDVMAGARYRAHPWLRRIGMEWAVRMVQEPRRLMPRYAATNIAFARSLVKRIGARIGRWMSSK
jgi:N-acetylglucosaminyldiphosphoundecaprenol N-acetyl-beta-D-mannosaminyltransferase